ncbi:hypothetical protein LCGC14_2799580, partial [marine sediment metagenome]
IISSNFNIFVNKTRFHDLELNNINSNHAFKCFVGVKELHFNFEISLIL